MLKVTDLSKSFSGFLAVDVSDFVVDGGARHAIIGPNGAGKTTFFNVISGLLFPDRGEVWFCGALASRLAPHRLVQLGLVRSFQRVNVFPRMTVFENAQVAVLVRHGGHLNPLRLCGSRHRDEVERLLEVVGLSGEHHVAAGELAHGKQKQLELAISLASGPKMLLLDEPTAGMSKEETDACIELIGQIVETMSITLLFTEHDMGVVFGLADTVSVLHHGRMIATGSPEEVRGNSEVKRVYLGHE